VISDGMETEIRIKIRMEIRIRMGIRGDKGWG
jgi:hypothetical protein